MTPRQEEFFLMPQNPNDKKKVKRVDFDREIEAHAERARVSGVIQVGYLPSIFAYEERYSAILPRLWEFFQAWDHRVFGRQRTEIQTQTYEDRYYAWSWIIRKWAGLDKRSHTTPMPTLAVFDSITDVIKKEGPARSCKNLVSNWELKSHIESISKNLNINFFLPSLLFPEGKEKKSTDMEKSADKGGIHIRIIRKPPHTTDIGKNGLSGEERNLFGREGDSWNVCFDKKAVHNIKHLVGMDYIKYLLENPNRPVPTSAFIKTLPTPKEASLLGNMHEEQLEEVGLTRSASLGFIGGISKEAKDNYQRRIQELEGIINDEESLRKEVSDAQEERKELIGQLKTFRDKSFDRPRTSVSNAITRARNRIRTHHPSLAEHLKKNIHLGYSCSYTPSTDPNWNK